ncbi:MAG: ABC transporter permease, partial [Geminicoccaceae bacterium]|nr:ABC transporter permease [Geminicoccaceae bacterium]
GGLVALLVLPVIAGLAHVVAASGLPRLDALRRLAEAPGVIEAALGALATGTAATLLSLLLALTLLAEQEDKIAALVRRTLALQLAVPHLALAGGLAFLLAPSGWLVRLISPWATGWSAPPSAMAGEWDAYLLLTLALVLKETPFLLMAGLGRLPQLDAPRVLARAAGLGYGRREAFWKLLAPRLAGRLRLPLLAVMAFGVGNVELALVLGPSTPPTLPVMALQWHQDADLAWRAPAAAAALALLAMLLATVGAGALAGSLLRRRADRWLTRGPAGPVLIRTDRRWKLRASAGWALAGRLGIRVHAGLWCGSMAILLLWSMAGRWRFPDALPETLRWTAWTSHAPLLLDLSWTTLVIGVITTLLALVLTTLLLELRRRHAARSPLAVVYLPLLLPQIAFYLGLQSLLVRAGLDGTLTATVLAHLLLVLPYVALILAEAFEALDPRLGRIAESLGKPPWVVLWRVRLPALRAALALAAASGFAVSLALYLPTLIAASGRHATLALELVPLVQGGDRRLAAAAALLLALFPLLAWGLAQRIGRARVASRR